VKSTLLLFVLIATLCISFHRGFSQNDFVDSAVVSTSVPRPIQLEKVHSPNKATLFSAVVPGLGQIYNKKYWKLPIVYGAIGVPLYFALSNQKEFNRYKTAYGLRIDGDDTTIDEFDGVLTAESINSTLEFHQRSKDLLYILTGLFYVFNIVDAAVDAHLFYFPKDDNLSFKLQPDLQMTNNYQWSKGFKLVIKL
jgi:TM2 domain-containing membrane protein YozV